VIRRQLAAEEAVTRVFSRVAALERERCFFISCAETMRKRFTFNGIYQRSVPWRTAKKIAAFGRRRRVEHGRTLPARTLAMALETFILARRAKRCSSSASQTTAAPSGPQYHNTLLKGCPPSANWIEPGLICDSGGVIAPQYIANAQRTAGGERRGRLYDHWSLSFSVETLFFAHSGRGNCKIRCKLAAKWC
jgi:hypothetical protein